MERGSLYDWDRHNKAHIAAHQVEPHEVEEVLANQPIYIETRVDTESGEERILELGHTNRGRVLFVAWTARGGSTRPVTRQPTKPAPPTKGDAMKKNNSSSK